MQIKKFKFEDIADTYIDHVTKHIPNYDLVIDKTIKICKLYNKNSNILDFGSATGVTLEKLHKENFINLYGVEPENLLRNKSNFDIASYSTTMPTQNFDVIIANWVLHFIVDKEQTLIQFYNQLNTNGTLIISEKVSNNDIVHKFYYDIKKANGVSDLEIQAKKESLVNVMHIQSVDWYYSMLNKIGFSSVEIIDGSWGFITLMVKK